MGLSLTLKKIVPTSTAKNIAMKKCKIIKQNYNIQELLYLRELKDLVHIRSVVDLKGTDYDTKFPKTSHI